MQRFRFGLTRPSRSLDPRTQAMRGDLADIALAGKLFAPHYAVPVERVCVVAHTPMLRVPVGEQVSELLCGEPYALLDVSGEWAWGYSLHDHYVGYVAANTLAKEAPLPPAAPAADAVAAAQSFLGLRYVWGGRGGDGIDCSGLVQRALGSVGIAAPRDSDMQQAMPGEPISESDLRAGDLVFFTGHVGIMVDAVTLLHATRHHGKVVAEPLGDVASRFVGKSGVGIAAMKRVLP